LQVKSSSNRLAVFINSGANYFLPEMHDPPAFMYRPDRLNRISAIIPVRKGDGDVLQE
jgi:hypothetical protein